MPSKNNTKKSGSYLTNDAATPIANRQAATQNSSQSKNKIEERDNQDDSGSTSDYVSGDSTRSSSSHQFHKS